MSAPLTDRHLALIKEHYNSGFRRSDAGADLTTIRLLLAEVYQLRTRLARAEQVARQHAGSRPDSDYTLGYQDGYEDAQRHMRVALDGQS